MVSIMNGLLAVIAVGMMTGMAGCADDSVSSQGEAYSVIVAGYRDTPRSLHIIDPMLQQIIDSVPSVGSVTYAEMSSDGNSIFVFVEMDGTHQQGLYRYNLETRVQEAYREKSGAFALVDQGDRLVMSFRDSIFVLDPVSLETRAAVAEASRMTNINGRLESRLVMGPLTNGFDYWPLGVFDSESMALVDTMSVPGTSVEWVYPFPGDTAALVIAVRAGQVQLLSMNLATGSYELVSHLESLYARVLYDSSEATVYVSNPDDFYDPDFIGCPEGEILVYKFLGGQLQLLHTVKTAAPVLDMAVSPDGSLLYCAESIEACHGSPLAGYVSMLDTRSMEYQDTVIQLPELGNPGEIEIGGPTLLH